MTDLISREAAKLIATNRESHAKGETARACRGIAVAIDMLPAQAPAVKVRALEWILPPLGPETAQTPWGRYSVSQWRDGWVWCWNGDYTVAETEEAAKAAAQADYAARILAAIEPAQGDDDGVN